MDTKELKQAIEKQAQLVGLELDATKAGYLQALNWLSGLITPKEEAKETK